MHIKSCLAIELYPDPLIPFLVLGYGIRQNVDLSERSLLPYA